MTGAQISEGATAVIPDAEKDLDLPIKIISEHLSEEGFRPSIDDDGSIGFKCEGIKLYLDAYKSNGGYRLYTCVFWELDLIDRTKAINAANLINNEIRCIKVVVTEKNTVWITYETHCASATEYSFSLVKAIDHIVTAVRDYRREFNREEVPVILNS